MDMLYTGTHFYFKSLFLRQCNFVVHSHTNTPTHAGSNSTLRTAPLVLTCAELLLYIHPISWCWHVDLLLVHLMNVRDLEISQFLCSNLPALAKITLQEECVYEHLFCLLWNKKFVLYIWNCFYFIQYTLFDIIVVYWFTFNFIYLKDSAHSSTFLWMCQC